MPSLINTGNVRIQRSQIRLNHVQSSRAVQSVVEAVARRTDDTALAGIWDHMSEHFVKRLVDAQADTHEFFPKAREHLNTLRDKAKYHTSVRSKNDNM